MSRFIKSPDGRQLVNLDLVKTANKVNNNSIYFYFDGDGRAIMTYDNEAQRDHVFNKIDDNGN